MTCKTDYGGGGGGGGKKVQKIDYVICERPLISLLFVWERETLAAVHSTHDYAIYGFWSNIISF